MATSSSGASNSRSILLILLASGFFITGLLFDYMPMIVDNQIKRTIELATNEEIRSLWSKPPIDLHSYVWLYEILNIEQFLEGEKVRVQKVGPFHFTSRLEKSLGELSQNKYRLIYNSTRRIKFNQTNSAQLDEPLRLLNSVYASLVESTRQAAGKLEDAQTRQMMISSAGKLAEKFNETLFINTTAREALLGRKLLFVEKARRFIDTFGLENNLPTVLENDTFGYISILNNTWTGPFEIYTGFQASMPSIGDIISYKGKRRLSEYRGTCNRVQTSAGELRPMPLADNQTVEMFLPNFCRVVSLKPTGMRRMREGLAISYVHSSGDFASASTNPNNECFCVNATNDNYCSLDGAIELAPCSYYSPLVLTTNIIKPDARITDSVLDWDPDLVSSEHEQLPVADNSSQLLLLKRIGIPIKADITYTIFMKVIRDASFRPTTSVPELSYIPILMLRETATIPDHLAQIIVNLENFLALTNHMKVVMYLSSAVLLCWLTGHHFNRSTTATTTTTTTTTTGALKRIEPSSSGSARLRRDESVGGCLNGSSDRVESADSTRSQPPSRMSRNSLSEPQANEDEVSSVQLESSAIISKVNGLNVPIVERSVNGSNSTTCGIATTSSLDNGTNERATPSPIARGRGKGWFMQVCSNLVRLLSGIRGTISEAGQLDVGVNEDEFRDKQLEMLAGRIDNWYSNSGTELALNRPASVRNEPEQATAETEEEPEEKKAVEPEAKEEESQSEEVSERRKESVQSYQTVINNKSDTSGDESAAGSLILSNKDKAEALEQVELALANSNGS